MPRYKNIVTVDKESDKRMYRILKECMVSKESIVDQSSRDWNNTFIKFKYRTENLQKQNLIEGLWVQRDRMNIIKRMVRIPKDVDIIEIPGKKIAKFVFSRRK